MALDQAAQLRAVKAERAQGATGSELGVSQCRASLAPRTNSSRCRASAITSKPATRDRLKTGHFVSFGDAVSYFELESFVKLAAL
jgi:hypothetical protein